MSCYACGGGKYRLFVRGLVCKILGHRWGKQKWYGTEAFEECSRCLYLRVIVLDAAENFLLVVLQESYSSWRSKQGTGV